jgi:aspartate/methionine/tyrosine aminotransferase
LYQYSRRLSWGLSKNLLSEQADERRKRGEYLVDLTNSNPTELFDRYPHSAIAEAFEKVRSFGYEPDPLGTEHARMAVSAYYAARGIHIPHTRIVLTASTSEAYALLFKLFCDPGDEVLIPAPSYPLFEFLAHLESVRVNQYRLQYDGAWHLDVDFLRTQITPRTRAIVIVNPNNPTGSFLKENEFEKLRTIAVERGIPIIADEVFLDYAFEPDRQRVRTLIGQDDALSFSLNGMSKAAGMPQMKLAWIAINGPEKEMAQARERLGLIADTYLSVGTPVQQALPYLFQIGGDIQGMIAERVRANLHTLQRTMQDGPTQVLRVEGGWSALVRLPATQSEDLWTLQLLTEGGILVQPGYFFDMASEAYIVMSLISRPEELEPAISLIHRLSIHP